MLKYPKSSPFGTSVHDRNKLKFRNPSILIYSFIILSAIYTSCQPQEEREAAVVNPPADGFNAAASDSQAIAMADSIMEAMGGRKAWDDLHFVKWNFFGRRDLIWDKQTGDVRIDVPEKEATYLFNVDTMKGRVRIGGKEITDPDSLNVILQQAKNMWINDSYWLFMPFKLKDSGVTISYMGKDTMAQGQEAEVLKLTFQNVGVTPNNKYMLYVDPKEHLIKQWAYYQNAEQDSASAIWPLDNYRKYNGLLLSADRSDNGGPRNVKVYQSLDPKIFQKFDTPELPE